MTIQTVGLVGLRLLGSILALIPLTAERAEIARLLHLEQEGQFNQPVFPILSQFVDCDPNHLFEIGPQI